MSHPQDRLQRAMEGTMDRLDRTYLRKLARKAYMCMSACYDQPQLSAQQVQMCVQTCSQSTNEANHVLNQEMARFQDRLQRCTASCEDEVRDMASPGSGQPDAKKQAAMQKKYESCVGRCVDTHIPVLATAEERIATELNKKL